SGSGTVGFDAIWNGATSLTTGKLINNGTVLGVNASSSSITFNLQGNAGNVDPFNVSSSTGSSLLRVLANGNVDIGTTTSIGLLPVNFTGPANNNPSAFALTADAFTYSNNLNSGSSFNSTNHAYLTINNPDRASDGGATIAGFGNDSRTGSYPLQLQGFSN